MNPSWTKSLMKYQQLAEDCAIIVTLSAFFALQDPEDLLSADIGGREL